VGALVGLTVGVGAAGPQADKQKTRIKKQNTIELNDFLNTIPRKNTAGQAGTKLHKGKLKNLCVLLSLVLFVSFVLKNFLSTWPIQQQYFRQQARVDIALQFIDRPFG
jgi:hypothetical protein